MTSEKHPPEMAVEYPRGQRPYLIPPQEYSDVPALTENFDEDDKNDQNIENKSVSKSVSFSTSNNSNSFEKESPSDDEKYSHLYVHLLNRIVFHFELEDPENVTTSDLMDLIVNNDEIEIPKSAFQLFTLWICSSLLELQLKPTHKPYIAWNKWHEFLFRYAHAAISRQERDEPTLSFQRNVFFPLSDEEKLADGMVLELLYEEAKYNVIEGRYPCETSQYLILGAIQARLQLGSYDSRYHTNAFFSVHKNKFLPYHLCHTSFASLIKFGTKNKPEVKLMENYKRIPPTASDKKLQRRYLEICWSLPYYGCAFFQAQIEEPVKSFMSFLLHEDIPVLIGINERGIYVVDNLKAKLLLGLKYEEFSWELANPSRCGDPDCLPCLFVQFVVIQDSVRVSKLLQIFSKQAALMDSLITSFVTQIRENTSKKSDEVDGKADYAAGSSAYENYSDSPMPVLQNRFSKLALSTFDEQA